MESKKINQLATNVAPQTSDLTIIGDPTTGVSKKITLLQIANLFATTGTVSSVAVTETGEALTITGSPITTAGTINIGFAGNATQYVRGDGALADFPTQTGGGSSVSYYLNSSVSQGTIGGNAYKQLSKTPIAGAGTDITISANGYIASYITDANDPALLEVPAGNFNCEFYFSVNSNAHNPYVYAEVYKYDGTTFTLLGSSQSVPEYLSNGTTLSPYYFAIPVAASVLTITDRIAIRIFANVDTKTVTLHTENSHLCQVVTTFSKGLTTLNSLTRQVQFLATGTSGTDFNISSATATHTFNIPDASATARGLITTGTQTIAGTKTFNDATKNNGGIFLQNASSGSLAGYMNLGGLTNGLKFTSGGGISNTFTLPSATGYTFTFPNATGTIALTSDLTGGTVTSVAALTIGTSGTDLSSSVANSTTTPVITLNVPTASAANRGALSSADWTTFNNKQSALTNPVLASGSWTSGYLPKINGTYTIGNSVVQEASGFIGIGVSPLRKLHVLGGAATSQIQSTGTSSIMYFGDASSTVIDNQGFGSIGNSLYLLAGGVERLYLTSTGNVGIGTANPLNRLFVTAATAGDYAAFIENTNSTNGYGLVARTAHTSSSAYAFAARAGATDIFIVRGDGRVGIGNTNPAYKLDVSGTGNFTGALSGTSATFSSTIRSDAANGLGLGSISGYRRLQYDLATTTFFLLNDVNTVANLSIGAATLTGALSGTSGSFSSTVTATAFIPSGATVPTNGMYLSAANTLNFATASTNRLSIGSTGAASFSSTVSLTDELIFLGAAVNTSIKTFGSTNRDRLRIRAYNEVNIDSDVLLTFSTGGSTRVIIDSSGRTSIGYTTNPSTYLLDVNGTGRFSGQTSIGGTILGSALLTVRGSTSIANGGVLYLWDSANSTAPYIGNSSNNITFYTNIGATALTIASTGAATFSSSVTATSLIKSGGTSSQFLMADGSVNTSVLPSGAYLPLTGGTLTGGLIGQNATFDGNLRVGTLIGSLEVGYASAIGTHKLDVNGTGRFSGTLTGVAATLSGLLTLTSGSGTKAVWATTRSFGVNRNFQIAVDEFAEGTFTITPSTTLGGSTYTTPIFSLTAAGAATFSGNVQTGDQILIGSTASVVGAINFIKTNGTPVASRITFGTDGTGYQFAIAKNVSSTITDLFTLQDNGAATFTDSIKTGAPSGGTAKPWKLGQDTSTLYSATRTIQVEIDGGTYYLLAVKSTDL